MKNDEYVRPEQWSPPYMFEGMHRELETEIVETEQYLFLFKPERVRSTIISNYIRFTVQNGLLKLWRKM